MARSRAVMNASVTGGTVLVPALPPSNAGTRLHRPQGPGAHVRAGSRAGAGDPVQRGRRPGQVQGAPHRRPARRHPQHRGQVREQGDVAHAGRAERDRGRQRDEHGAPVEGGRAALLPQRPAELPGEPGLAGGLAEQDRAGVAGQAGPAGGDLQGMVPPVMLHGEERSSSGD